MKQKIEAFVQENIDSMLEDIEQLVAVRSVKGDPEPGMPFGQGLAEAVQRLDQIVQRHGFQGNHFDGYMLTVNLNDKPDELGILCHLDVVPEGEGWTTPPYEMDIRDGKIYGRGVADNKGPAIAALYALRCVRELGVPLSKNVRLMFGTDEECGSSDLAEYFKRESPPPYCFSPDATFPVYNVEKGRFTARFSASFPESEDLPRVASVEGGSAVNMVPSSASAVVEGMSAAEISSWLGRYRWSTKAELFVEERDGRVYIEAEGASAHASYPEEGNNALTALLTLLVGMPFKESPGQQMLQTLSELMPHGDYLGKALNVAVNDEKSGALTCNLGTLRYSPAALSGSLDCRCPLGVCPEDTLALVEKKFVEKGFQISADKIVQPHHVPENLPFVQALLQAYSDCTGEEPLCLSLGATTYIHGMENSVAFGPSLPGTDNNVHGPDEHTAIGELENCVKIFVQVILDLCR